MEIGGNYGIVRLRYPILYPFKSCSSYRIRVGHLHLKLSAQYLNGFVNYPTLYLFLHQTFKKASPALILLNISMCVRASMQSLSRRTLPTSAMATGNRKIILWDYQRGCLMRVVSGFAHTIGNLVFLPNGTLLAAERSNRRVPCAIYLYDGEKIQTIGNHDSSITDIKIYESRPAIRIQPGQ